MLLRIRSLCSDGVLCPTCSGRCTAGFVWNGCGSKDACGRVRQHPACTAVHHPLVPARWHPTSKGAPLHNSCHSRSVATTPHRRNVVQQWVSQSHLTVTVPKLESMQDGFLRLLPCCTLQVLNGSVAEGSSLMDAGGQEDAVSRTTD